MGYAFRSRCSTPGISLEMLLDGGAVLALMMEETIVTIINATIARGLTPESEEWPLAGLQQWGHDLVATTVSADGSLQLRGRVLQHVLHVAALDQQVQVLGVQRAYGRQGRYANVCGIPCAHANTCLLRIWTRNPSAGPLSIVLFCLGMFIWGSFG